MSEPNAENGYEIYIERVLKAPRDKIWRCFTEAGLLQQWFCPKPWRVEFTKMNVRAGGGQEATMHGPNGETFPMLALYLDIEPQTRIITTSAFREGWIPVERQAPTSPETSFAEFADAPGGGTLYRFGMRHWKEEHMRQHLEMGAYDGWNICADQLDALALTL